MYESLQALLGGRVRSTWGSDTATWGTLVRLYRDYTEGRQRSFLTSKQRAMLNIRTDATEQFTLNYCDMVVQAMAERLTVTGITGDNDAASQWASDVLAFNRFDGAQMDVTEASIGDGVTFVMVGYDNAAQMPIFTHEPAWDGDSGLIPVYDRMGDRMIAAVKVWYEASARRMNLYQPDRVTKYVLSETGEITPMNSAEPWRLRDGTGLGVPIVALPNRKKGLGRSEIAAIVPSQDALNRSVIDMMVTSGLTAFQIKVAIGFVPPDTVAPGDWVVVGDGTPIGSDQQVDAKVLEQGQLVPFIQQCQFHIDQIGTVSRTPLPQFMASDTSSGEALKQKGEGLLGKVERYQVKAGNNWEDVMALAARVQAAFGVQQPPATQHWACQWKDPQKRNAADEIGIAKEVREIVGDEETLRLVAKVLDYDETKIQRLLEAIKAERAGKLADALNSLPDFGSFREPAAALN